MKLETIKVENFRSLKNFELNMNKDLSLVVGKNNSGKTSVLTIMDKLLNMKSNHFEWEDFNLDFQETFKNEIINYNEEEGMENIDIGGIKMTLFIKYTKTDSYTNIQKFMMDLNPDNNIVVIEYYYHCKKDKVKELHNNLKELNWLENNMNFSKFMKKNLTDYFVLERYARRYDPNTKKICDEKSELLDKHDIGKVIKFRSIKASREASNKTNDHSLSSLSERYYQFRKSTKQIDLTALQEAIENADNTLSEIYKEDVFKEIIESIKQFGGSQNETAIIIESSIQEKDLLKDNTTLFYQYENKLLPESYNGLGYLNLIGMIFEIQTIIAEFHEEDKKTSADINILFIEEPEAHTHPQLQYVFIKNIKELIRSGRYLGDNRDIDIQTIITTHSSHIVSECEFTDIRYLKEGDKGVEARNFDELNTLYRDDETAFKFVKQYLNLTRSELFFADKAIFIEGDTERILLPAIMKKIDDASIDDASLPLLSQNISIIEAGAFAHKFKPLIDFLGLKALVISDIDGAEWNSSSSRYKGCAPSKAVATTNESLKSFLEEHLLEDKTKHYKILTTLKPEQKIIKESVRVAYQIKENGYQANSFEDAFIAANFNFVKSNKENFQQGLKNRSKFEVVPPDFYKLAQECIDKKPAFASEILFYSVELRDEDSWRVPAYIEEGLVWLKKQ